MFKFDVKFYADDTRFYFIFCFNLAVLKICFTKKLGDI